MKPILFSENETNFTTNGLGRLDCISCVAIEERNGIYEIEIEISMSSPHAAEIGMNSLIGVISCDGGTIQAFRVYEISKPINGRFTVYARHISYDLNRIPCMPFSVSASPSACANTLAGLKSNAAESCPFTFWTDVTTAGSYNQKVPASIRQRLGGVEGSVLDQFGGEYEWDNFTVKLHKQRGRINTGISLRYGKNITDITQEESIASTVTGICPFWTDVDGVDTVTLPENVVYSQYADNYPFHLTEVHDFSQLWESKPSVSQLRSAAQAYVNQTDLGVPKVSIEVSFAALWQTKEYKDIAPLERVQLCDEIEVYFEKLGISATSKVVKTEYDVLAERYKSIQVGELRSNLAQTLTDREAETIQAIQLGNQKTYAQANATALEAINNATAWLTGSNGYVVAIKNEDGSWKELLFMDTNNITTAKNVLRLNTNGLGFSTKGINGPYTNAWTIDGNLVASFIKTGILSDLAGKFSLNMTDGTLSMKDGTFSGTINGATINGSVINVGTYNNADGTLNIYDASGHLIGSWGKDGINITKGSININGKFIVGTDGVMTCVGATISGNIMVGGDNDDEGVITVKNSSGKTIFQIGSSGIHYGGGDDEMILNRTRLSFPVGQGTVSTANLDIQSGGNVMVQGSDGGWGTGASGNRNGLNFVKGICVDFNIPQGESGTLTDSYGKQWTFENGYLTNIS